MMKNTERAGFLAVMLAIMLLSGCSAQKKERHGLQGAWALKKIVSPDDSTHEYHVALYRIYNEDGMMYEYQLLPSEEDEGEILISGDMKGYTLIDKGNGDFLYLEDKNLYVLDMLNDSTMVTQQFGMLYTWTHLNTLSDSRMEEIKRIVSEDLNNRKAERHFLPQEEANHRLIYIIIIIAVVVALAVSYFLATKKLKRRIRQKMRQLDEERTRMKEESEERLLPIGKAELSEVEKEFMQSVYYISLQHRLATGRRMKDAEWEEMEVRLNEVYPNFAGTLRGLCKMSETEWQVCMLIKLRVAPTEIAKVMNKDVSSISSIRKRLFQKVFGEKGKPKEWDDYILSL